MRPAPAVAVLHISTAHVLEAANAPEQKAGCCSSKEQAESALPTQGSGGLAAVLGCALFMFSPRSHPIASQELPRALGLHQTRPRGCRPWTCLSMGSLERPGLPESSASRVHWGGLERPGPGPAQPSCQNLEWGSARTEVQVEELQKTPSRRPGSVPPWAWAGREGHSRAGDRAGDMDMETAPCTLP